MADQGRKNEKKLKEESQKHVGDKTPVVGTNEEITESYGNERGFFGTIFDSYAQHYVLVTTPEDWWFTIIRKVALDIDAASRKEDVRNFFVSHEGKKELVVTLSGSVVGSNYSTFFDQMAQSIAKNLNNPDYVNIMKSDFGTSTPVHKIVNNIALMSSLQEYFEYTAGIACGIPKVDMKGTLKDWEKLLEKVRLIKNYLSPLASIIGQNDYCRSLECMHITWWPRVEKVVENLLKTYQTQEGEEPSEEIKEWWKNIVTRTSLGLCGEPPTYDGWFIKDFLLEQPDNLPSGILSVPLKIVEFATGYEEQAALVAGIPGYQLTKNNPDNYTRVAAFHGWSLLLDSESKFRQADKNEIQ